MFAGVARAVDEVVSLDVAQMCDSEIRETFIALRREIDRQEAFAAQLLAAVQHRGIPLGDGAASAPAWAQSQTGQRWGDAKVSLDTGVACESLPLAAKAWAQGEISTSAMRTIVRGRRAGHEAVYASMEETLVEFAAACDYRRLDRVIRHYQTRADAVDERDPSDRNHLHLSRVGSRWRLDGDLDELAGSTGDQALRAALDKPGGEGDDRSTSKRFADAFETVCRFFLDHADLPIEGGERPHLSAVVEWSTICDGATSAHWGTAFSPADIRQMLCDARISRVIAGPDGVPLDVGRATYTPSRALRRAVAFRDGGCRFPGCDRRPSWCQTHHLIAWEVGGETKLINLVLLCAFHHHLVHKSGWRATFDGVTFEVVTPDGRLLGTTRGG